MSWAMLAVQMTRQLHSGTSEAHHCANPYIVLLQCESSTGAQASMATWLHQTGWALTEASLIPRRAGTPHGMLDLCTIHSIWSVR